MPARERLKGQGPAQETDGRSGGGSLTDPPVAANDFKPTSPPAKPPVAPTAGGMTKVNWFRSEDRQVAQGETWRGRLGVAARQHAGALHSLALSHTGLLLSSARRTVMSQRSKSLVVPTSKCSGMPSDVHSCLGRENAQSSATLPSIATPALLRGSGS